MSTVSIGQHSLTADKKAFFCVSSKPIHVCLWLLLVLSLTVTVLMASVPPVSRDALTHHLAVPKLYLAHGGIYETPSMKFSYYPMNLDLLYLIPLYFKFDIGAKYIHYAFALLTAWLLFRYLIKYTARTYALLGAAFFLTLPVILKLSITAYVDLGLVFFSWACLYFLMQWHSGGLKGKDIILSAICCGLALGTKYNGIILLLITAALIPLIYVRQYKERAMTENRKPGNRVSVKAMQWCLIYIAVSLTTFSPWMIRNFRWTGNPVYPLYDSLFNLKGSHQADDMSPFEKRKVVYRESFLQTITIPLRIFFQGRDDNPKYFDGRLNPFLLLLPIAAFLRRNKRQRRLASQARILSAFSFLFIIFVWLTRDMRIRYMAPAIPPLVVLTILSIRDIAESFDQTTLGRQAGVIAAACIAMVAIGYNVAYASRLFRHVDPLVYLSGKIDRDQYISAFRAEYPVIRWANSHLPNRAKVLCMMVGNRSYYLDREFLLTDLLFRKYQNGPILANMLSKTISENGITHILLGANTYSRWSRSVLKNGDRMVLDRYFQQHTRLLYSKAGYQVRAIIP